ncbi:hypothetical protein Tco_1251024, partial [Tanacetum coccineum]
PRTDEEIAAKVLKDALKINKSVHNMESKGNHNGDGFTIVGKNKKPVGAYRSNGRFNSGGRRLNFQDKSENGGRSKQYGNYPKAKGVGGNSSGIQKGNANGKVGNVNLGMVQKPSLNSRYNANFQPKVLIRGSGSHKSEDTLGENVLVANSFQVLEDQDMIDKEEIFINFIDNKYKNVVWPKLQNEVIEYGMEPYVEVESENEGMAAEMGPENVDDVVPDLEKSGINKDHDFNVILDPSKSSFGSFAVTVGMEEFRNCISRIKVNDLVMSWLQFTWNKSPKSANRLLKKLDTVMCNMDFLYNFPNSNAIFLPLDCSDHAPFIMNILSIYGSNPKPVKFVNFLASKAEFLHTVKSIWDKDVADYSMFSLASKLKLLKKPFKKLKYSQRDLVENKAKISWLSEGDFNTKYFHNAMKGRRNRSRINYVEDLEGNGFSRNGVREQFVSYFEKILGRSEEVDSIPDPSHLLTNKIYVEDA